MKNKGVTILSIITNIILIIMLCSFISRNGDIVKEKQIIKEMSESTQITDLNNQINALNAEHTEYMNYIQTGKTQIATALANEGVITSNEATLETMAENISKVLQTRTADATATADNITEGKTAYVNGELIIGTGVDNNLYYSNGYDLGQENSLVEIAKIESLYAGYTTISYEFTSNYKNLILIGLSLGGINNGDWSMNASISNITNGSYKLLHSEQYQTCAGAVNSHAQTGCKIVVYKISDVIEGIILNLYGNAAYFTLYSIN